MVGATFDRPRGRQQDVARKDIKGLKEAVGGDRRAVTMPNAIRFEVHHPTRAKPARLLAAPPRRIGNRLVASSPQRLSRILVATDGTAASEGAVIVAGLLARRHHATVDVLSVLPRWGESPPADEFLTITGELLGERLASVIPQGQRARGNAAPGWAIRVIDSSSTPIASLK